MSRAKIISANIGCDSKKTGLLFNNVTPADVRKKNNNASRE